MPRGHVSIDPRRTAKGSFTGRAQSIEQGYELGFTEFQGRVSPAPFIDPERVATRASPSQYFYVRIRCDTPSH